MEKKILILKDEDFYMSPSGETLRGGNRKLYAAQIVIRVRGNGSYEVIKNRCDGKLSNSDIHKLVYPNDYDERLLLALC